MTDKEVLRFIQVFALIAALSVFALILFQPLTTGSRDMQRIEDTEVRTV